MSDDVSAKGRVLFGKRLVDFLRTWGSMEMVIDGCVASIYRYHDGEAVTRNTPVTIEKKLQFLKDAAEKIDAVRPYGPIINDIVSIVMVEKDLRNTLVHGWPIKVERNGTAHIVRLKPHRHQPCYELRVVPPQEWERITEKCWEVDAYCGWLTFGLMPDDVARSEVENVSREWFIKGADSLPASKKVRELFKELWSEGRRD